MDTLVSIIVVLVLLALLAFIFRPGYVIVPEAERLIIYRLGRFNRIVGPGVIWLLRGMETVQRQYSVRNDPQDSSVDGLMVYGVPIGLTLNIWWGYDPQRAAAGDKAKLANLALFAESERNNHFNVKLRDSLVRQINALEQRAPLAPSATVVDKIVPILPGVPTCVEILDKVQQDIARSLPALGIFLDVSQPIVITRLHPPEDLIKGFSRDRVADLLGMRFPGLPDSMMVHMLESIEGLPPLRVHEIRQVGNNGGALSETRWTDEDGQMFRVPLSTGPTPPQERASRPADVAADQPASDPARLSRDDLALLKRVPRESAGERRVA